MSPFLSKCNHFTKNLSWSSVQEDFFHWMIERFYELHSSLPEWLLSLGYEVAHLCYREISKENLWNWIPRLDVYVPLNELEVSKNSTVVLVMEFSLPNLSGSQNLSRTRYIRIEFDK